MIYNEAYYSRFVERANSELGKLIYASRWELVEKYCHGKMTLLDYGCGPGAFHKSARNGFITYGYDINPCCGFPSVPDRKVDILTMWDSIEHLEEPWEIIGSINPKYIFIGTPNIDSVKDDVTKWKHYRPNEHLHYFHLGSLTHNLERLGYGILEYNFTEGNLRDKECPQAIITVVAKRKLS